MFEIRTITDGDADLFLDRLARGFGNDPASDDAARARFEATFDYDRTLAVFDGSDIIGTGSAFSLEVTVPGGGVVPMGGTSVITVQPTHRRRGVLRAIMDRHLDDVADHEEPLAGLWASESSIYGRFGFGPATYRNVIKLPTASVSFREELTKGSAKLEDSGEAEVMVRSVYDQARKKRAGMLTRTDAWWEHRHFADPEPWRGGGSKRRYALWEEGDSVTGYAVYSQAGKWEDFVADGRVNVTEIVTTTPGAHQGLWSFLCNIDLFPNLEWWNMPIDDPLLFKITDPRRVETKRIDGLWVRLVDIPTALRARGYESDGSVTIDVIDRVRSDSSGTYRLEVVGGKASCERVSANPDLTLETDVLGHLYLGGGNGISMAEAGRIEGDLHAVATLHRIFRTDRAPWCAEVF